MLRRDESCSSVTALAHFIPDNMTDQQTLYNLFVNYASRSNCEDQRPSAVVCRKSVGSIYEDEFDQALTDVYEGIRDVFWERFLHVQIEPVRIRGRRTQAR